MQSKETLRTRFLSERKQTAPAVKRAIDDAIAQQVLAHPWFRTAQTVFVYYATDEEIATHALIEACWQAGKTVCVPRCLPKRQMEARAITSDAQLTGTYFGIPEPGEDCPVIPPQNIDLCLVPAMACDRRGYRLGYGGGFYDRFLPRSAGKKLALCAASRVVDALPDEQFDIRCDGIATEAEVIYP